MMENKKVCKDCNQEKFIQDFSINKTYTSGVTNSCKKCLTKKATEYYQKNKSKRNKYRREYAKKNKDKELIWREDGREKKNEYMKEYSKRPEVVERVKKYSKNYNKKNYPKHLITTKALKTKYRENLSNTYLLDKLRRNGFKTEEITPELLKIKKAEILITRIKKLIK